jgi:hypothetical protein
MKTLREMGGAAGILVLASGIAFGQGHVGNDPSQEVIRELMAHLPKGIKTGKQLPPFVKKAVRELVSLSSNKVEVDSLCMRLVVITDMDRYLDYMKVTDPKLRGLIKERRAAFTINEQWPIYINGESNLYTIATEIEDNGAENPVVHKLAAVLWHEMVHAQGQADEAIAIAEEIKLLERLLGRHLVEINWVAGRRAQLNQIRKGQISLGPLNVTPSKP